MKMPMSEFVLIVVGVAMFGILFLAESCIASFGFVSTRAATMLAHLSSLVANHGLYLFRSLVWLVVSVRYHFDDFDCAFNDC